MQPDPRSQFSRAMLGIALVLFAGGCATRYEVKVDAVTAARPMAKPVESYHLQSRAGLPEDDLRLREAAQHIKTALSGHGLYESPSAATADIIVELDYGIDPPRKKLETGQRTARLPDATPGAEEDADPKDRETPPAVAAEESAPDAPELEDTAEAIVVREKHLSIVARQNQHGNEGKPSADLWRVHASIEDPSADLRSYLPVLAAVALDQIGQTTPGATTVVVMSDDPEVVFIKKGL